MPDPLPASFRSALLVLCWAVLCCAVPTAGTRAQTPGCGAGSVEMVACIAGQSCTCRFQFGSPATGLADGYRWDCGILQPSCGGPIPATLDPYTGPLPESLSIESNSNTINNRMGKPGRPRY